MAIPVIGNPWLHAVMEDTAKIAKISRRFTPFMLWDDGKAFYRNIQGVP
jgi:hypothetical protein